MFEVRGPFQEVILKATFLAHQLTHWSHLMTRSFGEDDAQRSHRFFSTAEAFFPMISIQIRSHSLWRLYWLSTVSDFVLFFIGQWFIIWLISIIHRYLTCRYYARMHDYIPRTPFQDYILEFVYSCSWGPFWVDTAEVCINEQTGRKFTPLMHLNSVLGGPFGLGGPRRTLEEAATWWGCTAGNPAEFLSVCWLWSENFQWQSIHSIPQLQSDG